MIISHRFQTVFLHIPKNAGTSLREILRQADPDSERTWGYRFLARHYRFGDSAHIPLVDLAPDRLRYANKYECFAILRDPLERFISGYLQHFIQHKYRKPRTPGQLLDEIDSIRIRYDPAYIHFCPQHYFTHIGGRQLVEHLFRMDDSEMEGKITAFLAGRGFPVSGVELNSRNKTLGEKPELGDDFDMERFYQLYKRDYQLFGYEAPIEKTFEIDADAAQGLDRPIDLSSYDRVHFLNSDFERGE